MSVFGDALEEAHQEITNLRRQLARWEEREASVCPEDVGFVELIGVLRKQLAEAQQARECLMCCGTGSRVGYGDNLIECVWCGSTGKATPESMQQVLERADEEWQKRVRLAVEDRDSLRTKVKLEEQARMRHEEAVSRFLSDMYCTMIDPLADGVTPVAEMCRVLLKAAVDQRQREHDLIAERDRANELLAKAALYVNGSSTSCKELRARITAHLAPKP